MHSTISITKLTERSVKNTQSVPFGKIPTEHMFVAEYKDGFWQKAQIAPFKDLTISPLALCLHYGQTVFEGMKAFRMHDGTLNIFRMDKHYERFCRSLQRMCMPEVPEHLFFEAMQQLVQLDANWVPDDPDGSLYIRPFMIATEERIGVKIADEYLFMIICTPAYKYYNKPLRVKVETTYVRAAEGGTGEAKCGGNYGGAFYPTQLAKEQGYDQVLWTDGRHHEFIEESGTMNVMFVIDGTLITPPLSGTILDGVTRDSLLLLAADMNIPVEIRPINYTELIYAFEEGRKVEAFGAGTAAVVAPIETIAIGHKEYHCYVRENAIMHQLQAALLAIRQGHVPDRYKWNFTV
jgi:branched-chain amino acid aminotransferase